MIAIDIGNSSVKIGFYKDKQFIAKKYISIENIPLLKDEKIIISSVNPPVKEEIIKKISGKIIDINPAIIKEISFKYKDLKSIGQDRVAAVYSAYEKFGGAIMIVDFGTAITIDFLSSENIYSGGMIFPGPLTIIKCLEDKTALLEKHDFNIIDDFGTSSFDCMDSGITNAIIGLINRAIQLTKEDMTTLIFTGGYGKGFMKFFKKAKFEENLILEGLIKYGEKYG